MRIQFKEQKIFVMIQKHHRRSLHVPKVGIVFNRILPTMLGKFCFWNTSSLAHNTIACEYSRPVGNISKVDRLFMDGAMGGAIITKRGAWLS